MIRCVDASRKYDWPAVSNRYLHLYRAVLGHSKRSILDVPILATNKRGAFNLLERSLISGARAIVAFGNANLLNLARRDGGVRDVLRKFIVLNDGIGADIASRVLFGSKFPENLNGTDFVPYFLARLRRGVRVFLLGARPGIAVSDAPKVQVLIRSAGPMPKRARIRPPIAGPTTEPN